MSIYVKTNELFSFGNIIYVLGSPHRSNIGVVKRSEKTLLIDSGQNQDHLKLLFNYLHGSKIDFTILTHFHMDHTFGLNNLDCTSIGHKNILPNLINYQKIDFSDRGLVNCVEKDILSSDETKFIQHEYPDRSLINIKLPTITYNKSMTIDLGNLEVNLTHIDCDHTNDTTIVHVPFEDALFIGDSLSPSHVPNRHFTIPVLRNMVNYFLSFESKILVEGHGPPLGNGLGTKYLTDLIKVTDFVEIYNEESLQKLDTIMSKMEIFDEGSVKTYIPFIIEGLKFNDNKEIIQ